MLVWAYHPKLRPVAVAVVAIAVVVAVEAVDKWESYSWCRASPAFAPTQPLPLSWAVSVLSRGFHISSCLKHEVTALSLASEKGHAVVGPLQRYTVSQIISHTL